MALTVRQDGQYVGGQPNNATAAWWNDYYNLLTGAMTDQDVTLKTDLIVRALGSSPAAPTLALAAGTTLGIGVYKYAVTFVKQGESGETSLGTSASITTTSGNQAVTMSAIPTGPTGTTARKLYRTTAGGSSFLLLATINDNTTTTHSDTTADGSLGAAAPTSNSFGRLVVKDAGGTINAFINNDGTASFAAITGVLAHPTGPTTDDSVILYDRNGVQATLIGWSQNGGGMYAYDHVNNGYIFTQGTSGSITFGGTLHTNYGGNTTGVLGQITSNGGGAAGVRIWVGTTDPGSLAGEGDIWIKA